MKQFENDELVIVLDLLVLHTFLTSPSSKITILSQPKQRTRSRIENRPYFSNIVQKPKTSRKFEKVAQTKSNLKQQSIQNEVPVKLFTKSNLEMFLQKLNLSDQNYQNQSILKQFKQSEKKIMISQFTQKQEYNQLKKKEISRQQQNQLQTSKLKEMKTLEISRINKKKDISQEEQQKNSIKSDSKKKSKIYQVEIKQQNQLKEILERKKSTNKYIKKMLQFQQDC